MQPGLEDATSDAYNHTAISNSHGESPYDSDQIITNSVGSGTGGGIQIAIPPPDKHGAAGQSSPPAEKKKKSLFSRVAGTSKNKTTDALPEKRSLTPPRVPLTKGVSVNSDEGSRLAATTSASPPMKGSGGASTTSIAMTESSKSSPVKPSKKRDKKTNTEATQLRNQMLAAEYELARLSKSIRKKTIVTPAVPGGAVVKADKHHISQEEYNSLLNLQNEQQTKLQELKNKYTALTGI